MLCPPSRPRWAQLAEDAHAAGWQLALHAIGDAPSTPPSTSSSGRRPRPPARAPGTGSSTPGWPPRRAARMAAAGRSPRWSSRRSSTSSATTTPRCSGRNARRGSTGAAGSSRPVCRSRGPPTGRWPTARRCGRCGPWSRAAPSGAVVGPGEAVTVEQALDAWTLGAARACGTDDQSGRWWRARRPTWWSWTPTRAWAPVARPGTTRCWPWRLGGPAGARGTGLAGPEGVPGASGRRLDQPPGAAACKVTATRP